MNIEDIIKYTVKNPNSFNMRYYLIQHEIIDEYDNVLCTLAVNYTKSYNIKYINFHDNLDSSLLYIIKNQAGKLSGRYPVMMDYKKLSVEMNLFYCLFEIHFNKCVKTL